MKVVEEEKPGSDRPEGRVEQISIGQQIPPER